MSKLRLIGTVIWIIFSTFMLGQNGAGMSTLVALGLSIILGLIFCFSMKYGFICSCAVWGLGYYITPYALAYFDNEGVNSGTITTVISDALIVVFMIGMMIVIPVILFKTHKETRERVRQNWDNDVICCPACGRTAVHYLELKGYWKCTRCGHTWTDDYTPFL